MCHGRKHLVEKISKAVINYLKYNELVNTYMVNWVMIDSNKSTHLDILGSFNSMNTLNSVGLFQYDYVISMNCPTSSKIDKIQSVLRAGRWLLKQSTNIRKNKIITPNLLVSSTFVFDFEKLDINYPGDVTQENYLIQYKLGNVVDDELSRIQYEELYKSYNIFEDKNIKNIKISRLNK